MKQETLEEAAERYVWGGIYLNEAEKQQTEIAFIEGAKWQQDMTDNWLTMKEGGITINFKPMREFDDPTYPEVKIICPRCKAIMPCECNANWDTIIREFHIATQQVEIGTPPLIFECWLVDNYNPPTKKQDNE